MLEFSTRNANSPEVSKAHWIYSLYFFFSKPIPFPLPHITTPKSSSHNSVLTYTLLGKRVWWANAGYQDAQRLRNSVLPFGTVYTVYTSDWRRQWHPTPVFLPGKIPWTEEPGGLQSMGSLRVWRDWVTSLSLFTFIHWRRKWQPTPVFLPGESQGEGSLVGCLLWGRT